MSRYLRLVDIPRARDLLLSGRMRIVPILVERWASRYGRDRILPDLELRLRCIACGGRG